MNKPTPGLRLLRWMVPRLPIGFWRGLGALLGQLAWALQPARRRVTRTNIDACFPDLSPADHRRLVRKVFRETGTGLAECLLAWHGRSSQWANRYEIEGLSHLLETPGAQLLLMAHYPTTELVCRIVNETLPKPAAMVVRKQPSATREAWIDAGRNAYALKTIEKKNLRAMFRVLREGGRLMYGPDQNFSYQHVFVPFFGIPAATLTATAMLAGRTGATVVPIWGYRDGGRYRIVVDPPWQGFPSGDEAADARRVNAWMEEKIRAAPAQYHWTHRRFRTRPPGEPPFYADAALRRKHR